MPTHRFRTIVISIALVTAAIAAPALPQSKNALPSGQPTGTHAPDSNQSGYVLKVTTRLVTLDLIATDSHDKVVRDLKPEDLQVFEEHKTQQKIEQLEFIDKGATAVAPKDSASANRRPTNFYSNQVPVQELTIPPTVLLMDGVNTQTANQMQGRIHMLQLLKTLPPETPVAVLLLGNSLKVLQGFTNDRNLLRAAVDHVLTGKQIDEDPADDPDSMSNFMSSSGIPGADDVVKDLQDFEKEQYANSIDLRAQQTLAALMSIGQYLSGIPGRKNLIWASESFPFSLLPNWDTGKNPFSGTRNYADEITAAANMLTDAQVAVYPVDVRGLQVKQAMTASRTPMRGPASGPQMMGQMNREQTSLLQSQATMETIAKDTGGKTCENDNDLSGCVLKALTESSAYYELAYYPQNVEWDGKFHRIVVKTSRHGVKLTYRGGYFAFDSAVLAKRQPPEDRLRQCCSDLLPATTIHLTSQKLSPGQWQAQPGALQYLLSISANGLGASPVSDGRKLELRQAVCEYDGRNQSFRFYSKDLTQTVPEKVFQAWQSSGIPASIALVPSSSTRRVRIVLLDAATGLTGAIDIPVLASDIASANAPAPSPEPPATPSFADLPDREPTPVPPKSTAALSFHVKSGQAGSLDWNGDVLLYKGDLPPDLTAGALFTYVFGNRFRCDSGRLVPTDAGGAAPVLHFAFHNRHGKIVTVDLNGEQPEYQGDLPVDPSAKLIFDRVWKASHCQAP